METFSWISYGSDCIDPNGLQIGDVAFSLEYVCAPYCLFAVIGIHSIKFSNSLASA